MINSDLLPDVSFAETDVAKVEERIITIYEKFADVTLYPGDPTRLFLEGVSFLLAGQNLNMDAAGKNNLLKYAPEGFLDHLSYFLHTKRNGKGPAVTAFAFHIAEPKVEPVIIAQGVRIRAAGDVVFATDEEVVIEPGELVVQVGATCLVAGEIGNGFVVGQIKALMDNVPHISMVVNTVTSNGGVNVEGNEGLRKRTSLATEQYAVAGTRPGIEYHVRSAHQGIKDVEVWEPSDGVVHAAILMEGGELPTDEVVALVHNHLNQEEVKPFTDTQTVVKPTVIEGDIYLKFFILTSYAAKSVEITQEVMNKVNEYMAWQRAELGRDIIPSKLVELVQSVQGVQRVVEVAPDYRALHPWEVAFLTPLTIDYGGLSDE